MKHSEFRIGEKFWCGDHEWRCTDVGTRIVVAIQVDEVETLLHSPGPSETKELRTLSRSEAEAEGVFHGPPYSVREQVFDEYDMPVCSFNREGYGISDAVPVGGGLTRDQFRHFHDSRRALQESAAQMRTKSAEHSIPGSARSVPVHLLHGKGGSPDGTVKKLQEVLEKRWPDVEFIRLALPHRDPEVAAEASVEFLQELDLPRGAMLIGVSLGGLVAAKLQELGREDLHVIAISSPTWADAVRLERRVTSRVTFYSSGDSVIAGRVDQWPTLASFSRDFPWLTHDTDQHLRWLATLVWAYQS